jgi:hypothetical protein
MVILVAISIPTASMIGAQIQGMVQSTDFTAAGNLARSTMESLNNIPYASIAASGSATSGSYASNWTAATVTGSNGAERKDITLTAKRTGGATLVTLYNSIAKDVTYAP